MDGGDNHDDINLDNIEENIEGNQETFSTPAVQKKRGITRKPEIIKNRSQGKKMVVEYNDRGQGIGSGWTHLQSYSGVLARQLIPIIYNDWRHVPKEHKDNVWICIKDSFEVPDDRRHDILSATGKKWKTFKHFLNRDVVQKYRHDPALLAEPPKEHYYIQKGHWDAFVAAHTTNEFDKESSKAKDIRAKHLYPHRLSRKGYAGQERDLRATGEIPEDADRAFFWKKARQGKDGGYAPAVRPVLDRIDELQSQPSDSHASLTPKEDILTQALGNPEHPGRVRGMGMFVTPTKYFKEPPTVVYVPVQDEAMKAQMEEMQKQMTKMEHMSKQLAEMEAMQKKMAEVDEFMLLMKKQGNINVQLTTPTAVHGSSPHMSSQSSASLGKKFDNVHIAEAVGDDIVETQGPIGTKCKLALGDIDNIVAAAVIRSRGSPYFEVVIHIAFDGDAVIPYGNYSGKRVGDAIGSVVEWLESMVIYGKKKKLPSTASKVSRVGDSGFPMPAVIKMFRRCILRELPNTDDEIEFEHDPAVFGMVMKCYLMRDDLLEFTDFKEISNTIIATYYDYLFHVVPAPDRLKYVFVHPAWITDYGSKKGKKKENSELILNRLIASPSAEYILFPYNPRYHWVLAVVHIQSMQAYYLDLLGSPPLKAFVELLTISFKKFATHKGHGLNKNITWNQTPCPTQIGNIECGYYVMRYMRDILMHDPPILPRGYADSNRTFSDNELNEVRSEVATYVEQQMKLD